MSRSTPRAEGPDLGHRIRPLLRAVRHRRDEHRQRSLDQRRAERRAGSWARSFQRDRVRRLVAPRPRLERRRGGQGLRRHRVRRRRRARRHARGGDLACDGTGAGGAARHGRTASALQQRCGRAPVLRRYLRGRGCTHRRCGRERLRAGSCARVAGAVRCGARAAVVVLSQVNPGFTRTFAAPRRIAVSVFSTR